MLPARRNPFAMDRIAREIPFDPRWCGTSWEEIETRFDSLDRRAMVAGPHGSGKTTFLDAFDRRLQTREFSVHRLLLNDEHTRLTTADREMLVTKHSAQDLWFIDGAERLGFRDWRWVREQTKPCGGLLITTHQTKPAKLPLLLETRTSIPMLETFVKHLAPELELPPDKLERWFSESGGNLREALWRAYDFAAS